MFSLSRRSDGKKCLEGPINAQNDATCEPWDTCSKAHDIFGIHSLNFWDAIAEIPGIFVSGPNSDQHDNTHRMYLENDLNLNLNKTGWHLRWFPDTNP